MLRIIIITLTLFFFLGCSSKNLQLNDEIKNSKELRKLTQTIFLVERNYVDNIKFNEIVDRTIKGLFDELDENSKKFDENYSSFGSKKLNENILYLKVSSLNKTTLPNIKKQITTNLDTKGIILDLRNNKGRSFNEAIKIIDLFVDNETIALLETKNKKKEFLAKVENTIFKGELYVLINSKTISSAELIAGSLKELKRATLIGEDTLGNDIAIEVFPVSNNSNERFTLNIGKLYLPSGKSIKDKVLPDIKIKNREEKLKEAVKLLNKSN